MRLTLLRYGAAVAAVGGAVVAALWLQPVLDAAVILLVGVAVVAWFCGLWPALLASLLSTLAYDYFFTAPFYTLRFDVTHLARLAAFTFIAAAFTSVSAGRRNAERSMKRLLNELDSKVQERTADLEHLTGRLIRAQEEERSRIGRELHDHVSQTLGVLTVKLDQLRLDPGTPPRVAGVLTELRESTSDITTDIHNLSHRLHSSTLDYLGLVAAVERLVSEFSTRHSIAIDFTHASMPESLPSDVALCLFRVTEESLTNIAKHSRATRARISLSGGPDGVHLHVEDSGVGFMSGNLDRQSGLGFVSMRERLRALRGTVQVESAPSRGTRIAAWVPATADSKPAAPSSANLARDEALRALSSR